MSTAPTPSASELGVPRFPPCEPPQMSAMPTDEPAQDQSAIDTTQLQQQLHVQQEALAQQQALQQSSASGQDQPRKPKAPSVRRACVACHTGKTRCSEVLPCQSCLKRGLGASCAYPDPDTQDHHSHHTPGASPALSISTSNPNDRQISFLAPGVPQPFAPPPMYATLQGTPNLNHQQYYDYNGAFTGASTSTFRPSKRPRNLTEEEAAAITRNFTRGDFYVGATAPVRIDPRLPVRLTLGEGDNVHFTIGEQLV